jgi:hypothetical protein
MSVIIPHSAAPAQYRDSKTQRFLTNFKPLSLSRLFLQRERYLRLHPVVLPRQWLVGTRRGKAVEKRLKERSINGSNIMISTFRRV